MTTTLVLTTFENGYTANANLLAQLRSALQQQQAQVQWTDDNGQDYLDQTVTLVSQDLPETWGTYTQRAEVVFYHYDAVTAANLANLPCSFTSSGGNGYTLTNVLRWKRGDTSTRVSPLHSERRLAEERITIEGWIIGDPTIALSNRRTWLQQQQAALVAELNGAEGVMLLGQSGAFFNQTVRIENFEADIDEAIYHIPFRLTAQWTPYGSDPDFSITDFAVTETVPHTGEHFLRLAGKVTAVSEDVARTAYASLRRLILTQYGYVPSGPFYQPLRDETTANQVVTPDGTAFTELNFSEEFRRICKNNLTALFTPAPSGEAPLEPIALPNILKWKRADTTERVSPLHRHRRLTQERVMAEGVILSDPTLTIDARREWLDNMLAATSVAANIEGTLAFGSFNQVVKMESFEAQIDQEIFAIPYSFTAQWVPFPDPDDFTIVDYSVDENEAFTGEQFLRLTGKVMADTEDHARSALAALVSSVTSSYGYAAAQPLRDESTATSVIADADGTVFTELTFSYEWRALRPDNLSATFTPDPPGGAPGGTGGAPMLPVLPVILSNLLEWRPETVTERVSPLHTQRRMVIERVSGRGVIAGDPTLTVAARRTWLAAKAAQLNGLNTQQGTLVLAPFYNQEVKVTQVTATIDEAIYAIGYSFAAERVVFPNPASFAITDFAVNEQWLPDGQNTGEQFLRFSGKVVAVDQPTAVAKYQALKTAILNQYGYAPGPAKAGTTNVQPVRDETTINSVEADADGMVFMELAFNAEYRRWRSDNQSATFQQTGHTGSPVQMGQVRTQSLRYSAQRMNEHKSQRSYAGGRVELSGTFPGDMTKTLTARRKQLDDQVGQLYAEVNGADGVLVFGANVAGGPSFNQVVRVDDFNAVINQKITGIEWTLTASWSEFPNDDGFATTECTVTPRLNEEDGDEFITFSGRIRSTTKALAVAKLVLLRTSVLATYGYTAGQRLTGSLGFGSFYANGDMTDGLAEPPSGEAPTWANAQESAGPGTAFAELNFNEEYRRRRTDHVTYKLRISTRDDVPAGLRLVTYSGSVSASGATVDAAYQAALRQAQGLADDKEDSIGNNAFLRTSTVNWDQRQMRAEADQRDAGPIEFVMLEFSYEYQSKLEAGRAYYELNDQASYAAFEINTRTVSGAIVGASDAELDATYATIKSNYTGTGSPAGLFRSERTTRSSVVATANDAAMVLKLDFSFTLYQIKPAGAVSYRYGLVVEKDYLQLTIQRRLHGSCWAATKDAAALAVKALVASLSGAGLATNGSGAGLATNALGVLVRESFDAAYDWTSEDPTPGGGTGPASVAGMYERTDFDLTFADRLTGISGILEATLSNEVTYTAPRWVLLPALATPSNPLGLDVPQTFSTASGSRKVSGSVTAATLATAEAWAKKQRALLTGDADGVEIFEPESWVRGTVYLPRTENVQLYRVQFTFQEKLINYPAPA